VLDNIFNQLELDPFLKQAVRGVVIIAAVAIYARRRLRDRPTAATGAEAMAGEPTLGEAAPPQTATQDAATPDTATPDAAAHDTGAPT
jgi:ribose transport system permease protein